jgi:hypothetical protein
LVVAVFELDKMLLDKRVHPLLILQDYLPDDPFFALR